MIEKLKSIKLNVTFGAVISVVVGVLLLAMPGTIVTLIARILAIAVILSGIVFLISMLGDNNNRSTLAIAVAVLIVIIGIWMLANPGSIAKIIPIAMGVLLVVHGVQDFSMALETKNHRDERWWIGFVVGALSIILGIVCIANAFGIIKFAVRIIGLMLIVDGLTDMLMVHKVNKSAKGVVDSSILSEQDVDDFDEFK